MGLTDVFNIALAILASVGGGAAIILAFASWLGKVWAARILEGDRAKYANEAEQLRHEYARTIEQFRSAIQRSQFEHQTRFSYYHQKKAEVVAELYRLLNDSLDRLRALVSPLQFGDGSDKAKRIQETIDLYNELARQFYPKRIFLESDICDQVDSILKTMRKSLSDWQMSQEPDWKGREGIRLWAEAYEALEKVVPPLLNRLEERFRTMLSGAEPVEVQSAPKLSPSPDRAS